MQLLDDRSNARVRRDLSQLWGLAKNVVKAANEFSKVYGIFRTEKKGGTPSDFKDESKYIRVHDITSTGSCKEHLGETRIIRKRGA